MGVLVRYILIVSVSLEFHHNQSGWLVLQQIDLHCPERLTLVKYDPLAVLRMRRTQRKVVTTKFDTTSIAVLHRFLTWSLHPEVHRKLIPK